MVSHLHDAWEAPPPTEPLGAISLVAASLGMAWLLAERIRLPLCFGVLASVEGEEHPLLPECDNVGDRPAARYPHGGRPVDQSGC
jgi:hypothetical protein